MQCNNTSGSKKVVEHLQPMQCNNATGFKSQRVQIIWWCTPIRLQRTSWLQTFSRGSEFFRVTVKWVQFDAITEVETPGRRERVYLLYTFLLQLIFCILQFYAIKGVDNNDFSLACLKVLEARRSIKARLSSEHVSEMLPGAKKGCT